MNGIDNDGVESKLHAKKDLYRITRSGDGGWLGNPEVSGPELIVPIFIDIFVYVV